GCSDSTRPCHCRAELALECSNTTVDDCFMWIEEGMSGLLVQWAACARIGASASPIRCICAGVTSALSTSPKRGPCAPLAMYCQRYAFSITSWIAFASADE